MVHGHGQFTKQLAEDNELTDDTGFNPLTTALVIVVPCEKVHIFLPGHGPI